MLGAVGPADHLAVRGDQHGAFPFPDLGRDLRHLDRRCDGLVADREPVEDDRRDDDDRRRREAQPSGIRTFGSTFKNPEDPRAEGRSAGQLLEAAGCRGLRVGGARFSEKHANFVENDRDATTADVLALMAEGRRRVHERFGVELEPEVQVLGEAEPPGGWEL